MQVIEAQCTLILEPHDHLHICQMSALAQLILLERWFAACAIKGSGQIGIWMADHEAVGGVVIDDRIVGQPLDGLALGADIAERIPRCEQVRIRIVELVPESAKGAFALDGPRQPAPGAFIGDGFGEVGHVLVPDPGWQWIDADQVQFVEVDRCLPVDAGVGCPEGDLSGLRVDQLPVFVVRLISQRVADLL
jgi:hypothetical protein